MKLPVLSVADGAVWEERLVTELEDGRVPIEIVRRCVDVVDLLAVAASGQGRVALIAADLPRLDTDAIDRLIAAGVVPVGVIPRGDEGAEERLRAVGVAHLLPADAEPAVVAAVLAEAVRHERADAAAKHPAHSYVDPVTPIPDEPAIAAATPGDEQDRHGAVLAVWGPTGAPGRTTVAVNLADELATLGCATLLVDADVYGGSVATALGLLDDSPGLAAACRQAAGQLLDVATFAGLCWQLGRHLRVLTGLPLPSRWPEIRPAAIAPVLALARTLADFTVVDVGFCLETDEELSFDTIAPRRNGATLAVLDDADLIIVVGSADPVGMQRLVRGLADLRDAEISGPQRVVVNRVRDAAVPGDSTAELTAALERFAGRTPAAFLPWDPRSLDIALASGRSLRESNPSSPLRRAIVELAATLAEVAVDQRARRGRPWRARPGQWSSRLAR